MFTGLWSESTSNGFLVDTSAPVITKTPTFSADFGIKELTQVYRTSMKVEWTVDDDESFIKRQFLSVKSHIGGEFMLSSQSVSYCHNLRPGAIVHFVIIESICLSNTVCPITY